LGLGSYKFCNLEQARDLAYKARQQIRAGLDPIDAKRKDRAQQILDAAKNRTFEQAALEYFEAYESQWSNPHYRRKFLATLRAYAFKKIGYLPIGMIDTSAVLSVIEPIWKTKNPTADRVRGPIEKILDYATVRGLRAGDNPARWTGHLQHTLSEKPSQNNHFAAMSYKDVPDFVAKLREMEGVPPRALEFTILTASRSTEVMLARWDEIDLEKKLWTIPAPRMKEKREHRVPLTDRALKILKDLPREVSGFVFIGSRKNKPLGKNAFLKLLWSMKIDDYTVHGFRSSFRDWAGEETDLPADLAEVALSHVVGGRVQTAYQRGDLLRKRQALMAAWTNYLANPPREAAVIPIKRKRKAAVSA